MRRLSNLRAGGSLSFRTQQMAPDGQRKSVLNIRNLRL